MTDDINQPAHYTAGGIETIDVIEGVLGKYDHRDQVEKYNQRAHLKGNFQQDLEKARWYLNRTIENCEKGKLDPVTGSLVDTAEELEEEDTTKFDTARVHKDNGGDYWVYDAPSHEWRWYTLLDDLSGVDCVGGVFTVEEMERNFETHFIEPVDDEEIAQQIREAVEEYDNPSTEIVLGVTDPASMPVGTTAYRDGVETSYTATKEDHGWKLSNFDFFRIADEQVAFWFENEEGWSLEPPSDVYRDSDGDYWVDTGDGWRWHNISDGELLYTSIRPQKFEDIEANLSLQKLSDREAVRVRRIIKKGEK